MLPDWLSKRRLAALAIAAALAAPVAAAPLSFDDYSGVYIFGDSLVDTGNARKAANSFDFFYAGLDDPAPTSAGYYRGRFSNGYNYADHISLAVTGKAAKSVFPYGFPLPLFGQIGFDKPSGNNLNFGYGGAQAIRGDENVPGFRRQVDAYKSLPGPADPNALYVVNFGGNDLFQVIAEGYGAPGTDDYLTQVSVRIAEETARLEAMGAQHILVAGAPDIGIVPKYSSLSDAEEAIVRAAATAASLQLDEKVKAELAKLVATSDFTADLDLFSLIDFSNAVLSDPTLFGLPALMNFNDPCIAFRSPDASGSIDCTDFAFFDQVHPTSGIHQAIFDAISDLLFPAPLAAVAEPVTGAHVAPADVPETWAAGLLLVGLLGVAHRRRGFGPLWVAAGSLARATARRRPRTS